MILETMGSTAPWMLFLYALKAPATRDKYIQRLTKFLDRPADKIVFTDYWELTSTGSSSFSSRQKGNKAVERLRKSAHRLLI
jgi:hypothetical protein